MPLFKSFKASLQASAATLKNALKVVGKRLEDVRVVVNGLGGCVPRSVEKERHPPLRHQSIISGGNLRAFENLAQTLVAVDAS